MTEACTVYLSAGSNLGDRKAHLRSGIDGLRSVGLAALRVSSVFETEPVGFLNQPWFLNIVVEAETRLTPRQLLACCLEVESQHGRVRSFPGAPRTLDLDILLYGDLVIDEPGLQIPHPRMAQRRFVLEPLAQMAPEVRHPTLGQSIHTLLASCTDSSRVTFHSELAV
ncbi:MAG: 2-amino-4-hydroxy-6-hydroxymethyldihydropteridine diphosphokinase [Acidobacteriia bacterium]|nr:2-amino-4-hydroxy-6-hydroxymethyldihydropteridine diphosphokinase [Terriglobia bacterium]